MMRTRFFLIMLCAGVVFCACSRKKPATETQATKEAAPIVAATPGRQTVEQFPEDQRRETDAFGKEMESIILAKDTNAMTGAFDIPTIVNAICDGVRVSNPQFASFKEGLGKGLRGSLSGVMQDFAKSHVKYKGLAVTQGWLAARFRVAGDDGITFLDMKVAKSAGGKLAVQDFYNQSMGFGLVEQTRQAALPVLSGMDASFLSRLLNKPEVTSADIRAFGNMATQLRNSDTAGVVATYRQLPPALHDGLAATAIYITALQKSGDDNAYSAALKEADARLKSPNFKFMLVDVYFLEGNYAKAAECVDDFMTVTGRDAALLTLKSVMQNAAGDHQAALQTLREAVQLEPGTEYVLSHGVDVYLAAKDFAGARDSMLKLEKEYGYSFKDFSDPLWADFAKSPEFTPWKDRK